jgi:hypothetical protein
MDRTTAYSPAAGNLKLWEMAQFSLLFPYSWIKAEDNRLFYSQHNFRQPLTVTGTQTKISFLGYSFGPGTMKPAFCKRFNVRGEKTHTMDVHIIRVCFPNLL